MDNRHKLLLKIFGSFTSKIGLIPVPPKKGIFLKAEDEAPNFTPHKKMLSLLVALVARGTWTPVLFPTRTDTAQIPCSETWTWRDASHCGISYEAFDTLCSFSDGARYHSALLSHWLRSSSLVAFVWALPSAHSAVA
eukprot:4607997-Amphidinium_carterae.1